MEGKFRKEPPLNLRSLDELRALVKRMLVYAEGCNQDLRVRVLAVSASSCALAGQTDLALEELVEIKKISEENLSLGAAAIKALAEVHVHFLSGEFRECETPARRCTQINSRRGDAWSQAEMDYGNFVAGLYCGRPREVPSIIQDILSRAERIGHVRSRVTVGARLPVVALAEGDLDRAEQIARETLQFAQSVPNGFLFVAQNALGHILVWKGQTQEGIELLRKAVGAHTGAFYGLPEGEFAAALAVLGDAQAPEACDSVLALVPRPGVSKGLGAWHAVLGAIQALRTLGRNREAGRLLGEAERIADEWDISLLGFPARTAAGIAAACAGDWARAEQHHRRAIARMDEVPYVCAALIARYWYADMLFSRGRDPDVSVAQVLLRQTIEKCDSIGLALYGRLAREMLDRGSRRQTALSG